MSGADQPRDQQIIRRAINAALLSVRTVSPGTVVAYDHAEQTATVELGVRVLDNDEDSPAGPRLVAIPALQDVPVCQLAGGGFVVGFPLAAGDPVLVLFCEQDPSMWLETGEVSDPLDHSRHALHPVCIPGPRPATKFLELPDATLVVGKVGGLQMRINDTVIEQGALASPNLDFVALAAKVDAGFAAIRTYINTHTHPTAAVGPVSPPSTPMSAVASVKASKVKAE